MLGVHIGFKGCLSGFSLALDLGWWRVNWRHIAKNWVCFVRILVYVVGGRWGVKGGRFLFLPYDGWKEKQEGVCPTGAAPCRVQRSPWESERERGPTFGRNGTPAVPWDHVCVW